eukprot:GHRQ01016262.1.p1 GENE.GHRQ01016262.1~~GHRQ01016262.1.p1  ORF type:complete len:100 (-),score=3.36 GHRQ01016262.1:754-1053(-)
MPPLALPSSRLEPQGHMSILMGVSFPSLYSPSWSEHLPSLYCPQTILFTSPCPPPPHTKKYSPSGHAAPYSAMPYLASFGRVPIGDLPIVGVVLPGDDS